MPISANLPVVIIAIVKRTNEFDHQQIWQNNLLVGCKYNPYDDLMIWVHMKQGSDAVNLSYICWYPQGAIVCTSPTKVHKDAPKMSQVPNIMASFGCPASERWPCRSPTVWNSVWQRSNYWWISILLEVLFYISEIWNAILNRQSHLKCLIKPSVCLATICSLQMFQWVFDRNKRHPPKRCCFSVVLYRFFFAFRHETQTEPESVQPEMSGWIWGVELGSQVWKPWMMEWWDDEFEVCSKKQLETAILCNSICMSIFGLLYIYVYIYIYLYLMVY